MRVRFTDCSRIYYLEVDNLPDEEQRVRLQNPEIFSNLVTLQCNPLAIDQTQAGVFGRFLLGNLAPRITEFACNRWRYDPSHFVDRRRYAGLKHLYNYYLRRNRFTIRRNLKIYIDGVQLDLSRRFDEYYFKNRLIDYHYRNYAQNNLTLQPCPQVFRTDYIGLSEFVHELRTPGRERSPDFNLALIAWLYPNLRVIKVSRHFGQTVRQPPNANSFLNFLRHCRGLVYIKLINAEFHTDFYPQMAALPATQTLHRLTIWERDGYPERINLAALSVLKYFLRFETNLATRAEITQNVWRMRIGAVFKFIFKATVLDELPNQVTIQREATDSWIMQLKQGGQERVISIQTSSSTETVNYLNNQGYDITRHWLDMQQREAAVIRPLH